MKHALVVVHGTWGRSETGFYQYSEDPKSFCQRLISALEPKIPRADIQWEPFEWEHGNTHRDRLEGASRLAEKLDALRQADCAIHIIAHSHGGNVVLKSLEIYLTNLPNLLIRKIDEPDLNQRFDNAIAEFSSRIRDPASRRYYVEKGNFWKDRSQAVPRRPLKNWARRWMGDYQLGVLMRIMAQRRELHRVLNVVTLGTPFYFKEWTISPIVRFLQNYAAPWLAALPVIAIVVYLLILIVAGLLAGVLTVTFVGLNPFMWGGWLKSLWLLLSVSGTSLLLRFEGGEFVSRDTNIYFGGGMNTTDPKIRLLTVHAGLLDEPYLGLSAYPALAQPMRKLVEELTEPRFWDLAAFKPRSGVMEKAAYVVIYRFIRKAVSRIVAVAKALLFPVRWLGHQIAGWVLGRLAVKRLQVMAFGLSPGESSGSRISVQSEPSLSAFECSSLDASRELIGLRINAQTETDRFSFLWDDELAEKRYSESGLGELVGGNVDLADKRRVLAIEERGREFWGVAGVRHSMYYDNDAVIAKISEFIQRNAD